jgi:ribosome-associated protein
VILDVRNISTVTDYFVIFTGSTANHLNALGRRLQDHLSEVGTTPIGKEGQKTAGWFVFDYGNVIVHAMLADSRQYFGLERLWGDAPQLEWA